MADVQRIVGIIYGYLLEPIGLADLSLYLSILLDDIEMTLVLKYLTPTKHAKLLKASFFTQDTRDVERQHEMAINRGSREPSDPSVQIQHFLHLFVREICPKRIQKRDDAKSQ